MEIDKRVKQLWNVLVDGATRDHIPGVSIQEELSGADYIYLDSAASEALAQLSSLLATTHLDIDSRHVRELLLLQVGDIAWIRASGSEVDSELRLSHLMGKVSHRYRESITVFAHLPTFQTERIVTLDPFVVGPSEALACMDEELVPITELSSQTGCKFKISDNPVVLSWTQRARLSSRLLQSSLWLWARSDPHTVYHPDLQEGLTGFSEIRRQDADAEIGIHVREVLEARGKPYPSLTIVLDSPSVERWYSRGLSFLLPHIVTPVHQRPELPGRALRAVHWYGRVCWSHDSDLVVVGCCCALEALFAHPGYQKATRLAKLVQDSVDMRGLYSQDRSLPMRRFVADLYSVRNAIMHQGYHPESSAWRYRALRIVETAVMNFSINSATTIQ